jgi:thiosulfate reductase cytochrome b subunit
MSETRRGKPAKVLVYRHTAATRITHWINVLALSFLLMSGLQIFNAHPALYWGMKSVFAHPWLSMDAMEQAGKPVGVTTIAGHHFTTTGLFGWSGKGEGEARGFPAWLTVPTYRDLADGRRWHFFFAWLFVLNGLSYLILGLVQRHIQRDLWPKGWQLKPAHVWHEIVTHAQLKFPKGEEARTYNILQKGAYLAVILVLLPLMLATGLTMSPGFDSAAPWLLDLFGGRQSARSIHFITANLIVLFVLVHLVMVVASGTWNNIRSMITGRYAIETETPAPAVEPAAGEAA